MIQRLSSNLKIVRKERWKMSQDRFAQLFESSRSKINSYENGGVEPSIAFILKLQELTNIPALELFYGEISSEQIPPFPLEQGQSYVEESSNTPPDAAEFKALVEYHRRTHELLKRLEERIESKLNPNSP